MPIQAKVAITVYFIIFVSLIFIDCVSHFRWNKYLEPIILFLGFGGLAGVALGAVRVI